MRCIITYLTIVFCVYPQIVSSEQIQPCLSNLSVNITDGKRLNDGAIVKDNIKYSKYNYYEEQGILWGCICNIKKCIQTCCGVNQVLVDMSCTEVHNYSETNVEIYNGTDKLSDFSYSDYYMIKSSACPKNYRQIRPNENDVYLQRNGSVWINIESEGDFFYLNLGYYCIARDESNALIGFSCGPYNKEENEVSLMTVIGMIISMPFLLATFLVYAILPEPNLHRKALMNYVLTLLLAYITLLTVQLYPGQIGDFACALLGYMIIFFFLVSFFWMNVMCVDMWFTFSGIRGFNGRRIAERKRFLMYFAYAFGIPALHILVVYLINKYGDKRSFYYPGVGDGRCFLGEDWSYLFYFYGPMALLIVVNIILFALIAVKIQRVKKETSMLKHSESKRHSYEDDKQKFKLYVKLLFAMGINWTMEVVSWAVNWKLGRHPSVWYLTDFCNAMYGVFIFFMFVFKKKIWISLKKRYYIFRRKPYLVHSMSVTQSTRGSTTERGTTDHRLSELKNGRGGEERMSAQN